MSSTNNVDSKSKKKEEEKETPPLVTKNIVSLDEVIIILDWNPNTLDYDALAIYREMCSRKVEQID